MSAGGDSRAILVSTLDRDRMLFWDTGNQVSTLTCQDLANTAEGTVVCLTGTCTHFLPQYPSVPSRKPHCRNSKWMSLAEHGSTAKSGLMAGTASHKV